MKQHDSGISESDLHAYADGQLTPGRKAEVDAHLAATPADAARIAEWRSQSAQLQEAFAGVAAEPVPPRLSPARLGERDRGVRPRLALVASLAFAAGLGTGGLAVVGLLSLERHPAAAIAGGQITGFSATETSGMRMLAARALAAHRTFAVEVRHPVEVAAAEEQHLVQWLSKRLDYPIAVPDLRSEGFSLLGGRLLSGDEGPAALLMFESPTGERLTLYCTRAGADRETAFRYVEANGNAAFYWSDKDAGYALAGPAGRERLLRIARKTYEAMEAPSKRRP